MYDIVSTSLCARSLYCSRCVDILSTILLPVQIHLALCYEMVDMVKNDLVYMLPDENGQRVCALALRQLSHFTVQFVDKAKSQ